MTSDLKYTLSLNGSQFTAGARQAQVAINRLASSGKVSLSELSRGFGKLYGQLNGFSAISKLAAAAGGMSLLRNTLDANRDFEKKILGMKQLANMTKAQAAEMRDFAIKKSGDLLATPQEIAEAMLTLANAGMKYSAIKGTIEESARAALAFRASISDIANMDFDIQEKFKIDPSRMAAMHDMLYFHSNQGRFEAKSLSSFAPEYLNEMRKVGVGGEAGLNFTGALTQVMQKIAPATQPGEVATLIKHGLGHITQPHYLKGLKKFGIDVKKYMPDGKFYGEGGVQGMLDLADKMKKKGLDNPFNLGKAGFREQYTQNFWRQLMENSDAIKEQMRLATDSSDKNILNNDVKEIRESNYGKALKADAQIEAAKVGETASTLTTGWGSLVDAAVDHPGAAAAIGAGAFFSWRAFRNRNKGNGVGNVAGGLPGGAQPVFVTNWPGVPGSGGIDTPGKPGGANEKPGRFSKFRGGFKTGGVGSALMALGFGVYDAYNTYTSSELPPEQKGQEYKRAAAGTAGSIVGGAIGGGLGAFLGPLGMIGGSMIGSALGNAIGEWMAKSDSKPVVIQNQTILDSQVVAESVNRVNARQGARG